MILQDDNEGATTFVYRGNPDAREVYLVGDFNSWDPTRRRMVKMKDGSFQIRLKLSGDEHQYMFVVDGNWTNDPSAERAVPNAYGKLNSVVPARGSVIHEDRG